LRHHGVLRLAVDAEAVAVVVLLKKLHCIEWVAGTHTEVYLRIQNKGSGKQGIYAAILSTYTLFPTMFVVTKLC